MTAIEKTKATKPEPYRIKADERPERYARGWYVIGDARSVSHKPRELKVFGTKLVAYRDKDRNFVRVLLLERMIDPVTLKERIALLDVDDPSKHRLIRWVETTYEELSQETRSSE